MLIFSIDKPRLLRHFQKDEVLFSYHIGDLDDYFFNDCQWTCWYTDSAKIQECILIYSGGETASVLAFGLTDNFSQLLNKTLPLLPPKFYCHFQKPMLPIFLENYNFKTLGIHYKMNLKNFNSQQDKNIKIVKLDSSSNNDLLKLYQQAYPENYYNQRMLGTGKYYASIVDKQIASVSGVHVYSDKYKIAVLGNITTHPDFRGQGLSTKVTSKLLSELDLENMTVCLNVKADNFAAIKSYEKLGFEKIHEYEEGFFELL